MRQEKEAISKLLQDANTSLGNLKTAADNASAAGRTATSSYEQAARIAGEQVASCTKASEDLESKRADLQRLAERVDKLQRLVIEAEGIQKTVAGHAASSTASSEAAAASARSAGSEAVNAASSSTDAATSRNSCQAETASFSQKAVGKAVNVFFPGLVKVRPTATHGPRGRFCMTAALRSI